MPMTADKSNFSSIGLRPGDKIDKYEVVEQIGAGGFSVVWKAYDRLLDKHVAVKQITVDPSVDQETFRERFRKEAAIQKKAAQEHKHLVRIIDFIEDPRGLFILMEYVNGPSLEHLLAQNPGPVDVNTALGIAAAAAVALGAIHDQGIVHRDLKPANILLPNEGGLKICDFGLASLMEDQETPSVGTVRYMAPELLDSKQADGRADLYSLGMMLYEMLIGRANFEDSFKTVLRDQRNVALRWMKWHTNLKIKATPIRQYVPAVPEGIAQLVERMMEKDPVQRIGSANELIQAMRRQLANPSAMTAPAASARPTAVPTAGPVGDKTVKVQKKSKVMLIAAVTIIIWTILGIGYLVISSSNEAKRIAAVQSEVRNDYIAAVALFKAEDWDKASVAFKEVLGAHKNHLELPVPVAGNERRPLETAVAGHLYFCDARRAFAMNEYDQVIQLLFKVEDTASVDVKLVQDLMKEAEILKGIDIKEKSILSMINQNRFFDARNEWTKFRIDGAYKMLSPAQQQRWNEIGPVIDARRDEHEVKAVMADVDRLPNLADKVARLEQWLADNPGNDNRMIRQKLDEFKGEAEFTFAVDRAKSSEQRSDYAGAITQYELAVTLNRTAAEKLDIPSHINKLKAEVAFAAAVVAMSAENMEEAVTQANRTLSFNKEHQGAKDLLKQVGSAELIRSLRRQAVAFTASREYVLARDTWQKLRDDHQQEDAAEEMAKLDVLLAIEAMEEAWRGDDDTATLAAVAKVLALDPANERALILKDLLETRRRILTALATAANEERGGRYPDAKRTLLKAQSIARSIPDRTVSDQMTAMVSKKLDDVEYLDFYHKAKNDFEVGSLITANSNIISALRTKTTPEAQALNEKIKAALEKQKQVP